MHRPTPLLPAAFRVRYQVYEGRDFVAPGVFWIEDLEGIEACQRAYVSARDALGLGASQFGCGDVCAPDGRIVGRISYNGRLWPVEPWHSGQKPLAEAPQ